MKKFAKLAVVIGLALSMVCVFTACGGSSEESASTSEVYTVALEPTFPPFDTTDEDGNLDGFDVALVNAIAEDQGFEVEWENMEFDGLIPALQSGNIDIVASGMSITDERSEQVDFSDPYYDSGLIVAVKGDNDSVGSIDDLTTDMVIGVQIGTSGASKAEELKENGQIGDIKTYNGLDVAFKELENGTIDAIINDAPVTEAYVSKQGDAVKTVGEVLDAESYGIAVQKDNSELLDKINAGLANIKENGTYDELLEKMQNGDWSGSEE